MTTAAEVKEVIDERGRNGYNSPLLDQYHAILVIHERSVESVAWLEAEELKNWQHEFSSRWHDLAKLLAAQLEAVRAERNELQSSFEEEVSKREKLEQDRDQIAAKERERCAKVCEEHMELRYKRKQLDQYEGAYACAKLIRAMKGEQG